MKKGIKKKQDIRQKTPPQISAPYKSGFSSALDEVCAGRRIEQKLAELSDISNLITESLEDRNALLLAADRVTRIMDSDAIIVYLIEEDSNELVLELYRGVSDDFVNGVMRISVGEGFNGKVAETGQPLIVEDATTDSHLIKDVVVTEGIKSQLIVPLRSKGNVIGTVCVARRKSENFYADEVGLLSSIGNQIGATLENARLYQDMKRTLNQLQQSEERYRDLFENASDAIWVHDLEGNTLTVNQACEKVTGYSSKELRNMPIDMLMDLFGKSCIEHIEDGLLRDEPIDHRCEVRLDRKGGTKAVVEVTTSLMAHDGEVVGFQHAARDVTEERRMQENLRYYLQQVTRAQEEERKRIARELHDETLQSLIVISRQLDKITSSEALWEESLEVVRGLKKQIETAVQEIRRFSHDLRPSVLDDLGLLPALELLADDLEKQGIVTAFKVIGKARRLTPEAEVMLFRIAQEATRNIWRHSDAATADMTLEFINSKLRMSIKDSGKGFRLPQSLGDQASKGKLGLAGMQERARLLGATLKLKSKPRMGTTIVVEVKV
ncbi:MAG: PAS domain S-box protein [Chloroflexi bacterium]|nr:PAS domain S-box protein [Chloroflexota bacterium]